MIVSSPLFLPIVSLMALFLFNSRDIILKSHFLRMALAIFLLLQSLYLILPLDMLFSSEFLTGEYLIFYQILLLLKVVSFLYRDRSKLNYNKELVFNTIQEFTFLSFLIFIKPVYILVPLGVYYLAKDYFIESGKNQERAIVGFVLMLLGIASVFGSLEPSGNVLSFLCLFICLIGFMLKNCFAFGSESEVTEKSIWKLLNGLFVVDILLIRTAPKLTESIPLVQDFFMYFQVFILFLVVLLLLFMLHYKSLMLSLSLTILLNFILHYTYVWESKEVLGQAHQNFWVGAMLLILIGYGFYQKAGDSVEQFQKEGGHKSLWQPSLLFIGIILISPLIHQSFFSSFLLGSLNSFAIVEKLSSTVEFKTYYHILLFGLSLIVVLTSLQKLSPKKINRSLVLHKDYARPQIILIGMVLLLGFCTANLYN